MSSWIKALLQLSLIGYVLTALLFWTLSDGVLFQPPSLPPQAIPNTIQIPLANHQNLSAVYLPNPGARYTILFSHGNAEDLSTLYPFLKLLTEHGYAVFAYDYPGYGQSTGKPSERGTYQAIDAAYQYMTTELNIPADHILLYGRSLGAGPTIELASHSPCAGLILESAFVSAYRVYTYLPLIPFDKYRNLHKIAAITVPILLIHGTHDSVIPIWHSKKLFAHATSPKQAYWVEGASHNNVLSAAKTAYWQAINHFVTSLTKTGKE